MSLPDLAGTIRPSLGRRGRRGMKSRDQDLGRGGRTIEKRGRGGRPRTRRDGKAGRVSDKETDSSRGVSE
jgi:hypothetical protein